ncbi:AlpA family phage regulatory protein [Gammaproteobacteria bacterium LSUCC0112]|nr:AlpA family phage regulatory protein [Gammaproteobacteria bacterium LSUCC0112]
MKLLNKRQLREKTSISNQHLDRLEKEGKFPLRIKLTDGIRVAWLESEVDDWIAERVRLRDSQH